MRTVARRSEPLSLRQPRCWQDIDRSPSLRDQRPPCEENLQGPECTNSVDPIQVSPDSGVTALLKRFMLDQMGAADTAELDLKLRIVSEAGERLIAHAYEQPTREDRDRVIAEMKKMLASYLFPHLANPEAGSNSAKT